MLACYRPLVYRVFIWTGAKRIQEVMLAKGYILGTSQILHNLKLL